MRLQILCYVLLQGAVLAGALALSMHYRGTDGLIGFFAGAGAGLFLNALSHLLWLRARNAGPERLLAAVFAAVLASFFVLGGTVITVGILLPSAAVPCGLTGLAVYLVHRFYEAALASAPAARVTGRIVAAELPADRNARRPTE